MQDDLYIYQPPSETPAWRVARRRAAASQDGGTPVENETQLMQRAARDARRRRWAADVAAFYAKQRFDRSGRDEDRQIWRAREQEAREAAAALEAAEEALLRLPQQPPS